MIVGRGRWSLVVVGLAVCGCGETEEAPSLPSFRHQALYERIQGEMGAFTRVDGDYKEDFGDAAFYGLAFAARAGLESADDSLLALADEMHARNVRVITDPDLMNGDVNEMAMGTLGLVDHIAASGDRDDLPVVDEMIGTINGVVSAVGHYLAAEMVPGYSMTTYGPTSVNGLMAMLSLQRALLLGPEGNEELVDFVEQVVARIDEVAWNGTVYELDDGLGRPGLFLYPNVTMILVHARLFQLGAGDSHRERALALYEGIQPLKVREDDGLVGPGRYRSPYSAEVMGAQTDDYTTFSSQSYLMLALMLLYEITGDPGFVEQIDPVLDFLEQDLWGGFCTSWFHDAPCEPACGDGEACIEAACTGDSCGQAILHHWMDGASAEPDDLEIVCSGCQYQLLYLLWYRQHLPAPSALE